MPRRPVKRPRRPTTPQEDGCGPPHHGAGHRAEDQGTDPRPGARSGRSAAHRTRVDGAVRRRAGLRARGPQGASGHERRGDPTGLRHLRRLALADALRRGTGLPGGRAARPGRAGAAGVDEGARGAGDRAGRRRQRGYSRRGPGGAAESGRHDGGRGGPGRPGRPGDRPRLPSGARATGPWRRRPCAPTSTASAPAWSGTRPGAATGSRSPTGFRTPACRRPDRSRSVRRRRTCPPGS